MLLTSIDVAVPRACAAVPIDSPCAFALRTRAKPIVLYPHTAHSKPTLTTTAAVSEGMPPTAFVTSMAIGVVTDFDANDKITSFEAPIFCATYTTEMMPTTQPASSLSMMGTRSFFIFSSCMYKGTPSATTAGRSQNSIMWPPAL